MKNHKLYYGDNTLREKFNNRIKYIDNYKKDSKDIEYSYYITNNNIYEINIRELTKSKLNIILYFYNNIVNNNSILNLTKKCENNIFVLYNIDLLNQNEQYNLLTLMNNKDIIFYIYTSNINNVIYNIKNRCNIIKTKKYTNNINVNHKKKLDEINFLELSYTDLIKNIYNCINDNYTYNEILFYLYNKYFINNDNDGKVLDKCLELSNDLFGDESSRKVFILQYFIYYIKNEII